MVQVSRLLVILSLISLTSSAQSESPIQTTSNGQSAVFPLSNRDTVVVGFRTEHECPHINYTVYYLGEIELEKKFQSFTWKSQWSPLLKTLKVINGTKLKDPKGLDTRYVSLSSTEEVQWLMMTLPLKDHELKKATPKEEVFLDLPEEDDVWVAVWNKLGRKVRTELRLLNEQEKYLHLNINVSEDWSFICINKVRILYGYDTHLLTNKGLKGRRLQMKSDGEVQFQVFPVPLKPTDAATLLIAIAVIITSVVILGTFFGCKFFWKKRNGRPTEGATSAMFSINNPSSADEGVVPTQEHFGAVSHPEPFRPSSCHESENSLYGAVIPS